MRLCIEANFNFLFAHWFSDTYLFTDVLSLVLFKWNR